MVVSFLYKWAIRLPNKSMSLFLSDLIFYKFLSDSILYYAVLNVSVVKGSSCVLNGKFYECMTCPLLMSDICWGVANSRPFSAYNTAPSSSLYGEFSDPYLSTPSIEYCSWS